MYYNGAFHYSVLSGTKVSGGVPLVSQERWWDVVGKYDAKQSYIYINYAPNLIDIVVFYIEPTTI